jgi:CRISPR system Cascade subunit CasD
MHTLLLRMAGPMQAWGTQSRFLVRDTGLEPSKSGVVGLLCAALGRGREEAVDDLAELRMGVRVDREGVVRRDYQTAQRVARAGGGVQETVVSERLYLADADYLVGLAGEELALLQRLDAAVRRPVWPIFLGRKAFVPGSPVGLPGEGVRAERELTEALLGEEWRPWPGRQDWRWPARLRLVVETDASAGDEVRQDQPGPGAAFAHRRFLPRTVVTSYARLGEDVRIGEVRGV